MAESDFFTIDVTGINKNTSKDTLYNYFSLSKNGGDIDNVSYIPKSGRAIIQFSKTEGNRC